MKQEHVNEIKAILVLAIGMTLLASLISFVPEDLPWYTSPPNVPAHNLIRVVGAYCAGTLLFIMGYSSYVLVLFLFFWSWNKFLSRQVDFSIYKFIGLGVLICVASAFFSMLGPQASEARFERSGYVGHLFSGFLLSNLDRNVAYLALITLGILALILTGEFLLAPFVLKVGASLQELTSVFRQKRQGKIKDAKDELREREIAKVLRTREEKGEKEEDKKFKEKTKDEAGEAKPSLFAPLKPKISINQPSEEKKTVREEIPLIEGDYTLPPLDLLTTPPHISTTKLQSDLISGARLLESTLASFGVSARVADIEQGPAITRYELEPAPGVKVQKFTTLENDIALAMKAQTVRIVAPIPGKNRVGIEVPNQSSASVFLKEVLMNSQFRSFGSKLTLALGKDITGKTMIADLTEMPHLLIAGTTGSGKTVCVNGIIMSMLFNATPNEIKFVMVDPKMVELSMYNDLPHLLCPVVTDVRKVSNVLNWVVAEMESRYRTLSKEGLRNIKAYNDKGKRMPYIVVVIDELADLMQVSAKTVESSITRLAQLSRAVGIHLILATQRPSVDVITGVIKANFPARISFKVASKVDSRTVLDMNGAETLLGKGDMLFIKPGDAKPTRGQCSFVKDDEIQKVIEYIKKQQKPIYDEKILTQQTSLGIGQDQDRDEFYDEAVKLVMETNQASVSIIQRRLRLGYTRAARLIDIMEQHGMVGPYVGSKPREILVDREKWLLDNMKNKEDQSQHAQSTQQ